MALNLEVFFQPGAFPKASELWELGQFSIMLDKHESNSPIINDFTGNKIKITNIAKSISKGTRLGGFSLRQGCGERKDQASITFIHLPDWDIARLDLSKFDKLIEDRASWLPSILQHQAFISARITNSEYCSIQNRKDLQSYELLGIDHSKLPKIKSGLPFPLPQEKIDISNNPGRWLFKKGYIEAIAAEMWLSPEFFNRVNLSEQAVLESNWLQTEKMGDVMHIKAYHKPFDSADGEQGLIQDKLRHLLFSGVSKI